MDLADTTVVLRPRTVGEIADLTLRWTVDAGARLHLRLGLIFLLPSLALCAAARYLGDLPWEEVWALACLSAYGIQAVLTVAAGRLVFEPDVTARAVIAQTVRSLPRYLPVLLASGAILLVSAPFLIPIPLLWPRLWFVHEACLLEGGGPVAAFRRSNRITGGRHVQVLGAMMLQGLALLAAVLVAEQLGGALFEFVLQLGRPFGRLEEGGSLSALVGFHLALPFVVGMRLLHYIDIRTRQDGWDLQVRLMAIRAAAERENRP